MEDFARLEGIEKPPPGGRAVAIGVFDGVHLGHQRIIAEAVAAAQAIDARPTVVTFYPHPEVVLRPGSGIKYLALPQRKAEVLAALGIEDVVTVEFDRIFAQLSPESFCGAVLSGRLDAKVVVVGEDFRFGHKGVGTVADLAAFGATHGFEVASVSLVSDGGGLVSSTRIRNLLGAGEVATAAELLGRPHRLEGVVASGSGRGRSLQAPTANLEAWGDLVVPRDGVYVTRTTVAGAHTYDSVTSVGINPTFANDGETRVETLLFDYEGDLYGSRMAIDFLSRLRDQEAFDDPAALADQIRRDVAAAEEVHRRLG